MSPTPYDPQDFSAVDRLDPENTENGKYEITITIEGAARVNRFLSWIVRSHAYDDVTSLAVALSREEEDKSECA